MLSYLPIALLGISATVASPVDKRTVDNTQPAGSNPIAVASTQFLGAQASDNSCSKRDLGFAGRIAGKWYAVYGALCGVQPELQTRLKRPVDSMVWFVTRSRP
jgi:hypothetical protein